MKKYAKYLTFSLLLVLMGAFAQDVPPAEGNPAFSQPELDQMLAPIALYPDSLLAQILMAATYPLEVVEAARWSRANSTLGGEEAIQAVDSQNWDSSVKSLVAFPQVLQTLDQNIEWTERLGDAFLAQQPQVMDTVQNLRQKAQQAGNLDSNSQINVTQSDDSIQVAPANPDMEYVPYYDPEVAYGSWWWPDNPPVFWAPWPDYGWSGGFAWGIGIGIGADFFSGSWDWRNHRIYPHNPRHPDHGHAWQHDPGHRHGVPYRDASLNRQFGRAAAPPASRAEFRGYAPPVNARPREPGRSIPTPPVGGLRLPETRETMAPRSVSPTFVEPRAHAFENVGRGADVRSFSARGNASLSSRPSAPESLRAPSPGPSFGPSHRQDN
ncbi:MAG: DUF3300 domain-containing protein [Gallionellaceae bacterium]